MRLCRAESIVRERLIDSHERKEYAIIARNVALLKDHQT